MDGAFSDVPTGTYYLTAPQQLSHMELKLQHV